MRRIRDLGLKRIEIVIQNSELDYGVFRRVRYSRFKRLRAIVEGDGLNVVSVHAPFFSGVDVFSSKAREEILLGTLEIASLFGANQIIVHPYHIFLSYEGLLAFLSANSFRPQRYVLPRFRSILRNAEERGVTLAVENVSHWYDHPLLNEPRNILRIMKAFQARSMRVDLDIFHSEYASNTGAFLRSLSKSIVSLHVSDISELRERTLPGLGKANWDEISQLAKSLHNLKHVILEVTNQFNDVSIKRSIKYLERVLDSH